MVSDLVSNGFEALKIRIIEQHILKIVNYTLKQVGIIPKYTGKL
jgi:hypothetical protein